MTFNRIMLEAIYGVCCNEATAPSYITRFLSESFEQLNLISDEDIEVFQEKVKETIRMLKQAGLLYVEYYCNGEFQVIATNKFEELLEYDFKEVQSLC